MAGDLHRLHLGAGPDGLADGRIDPPRAHRRPIRAWAWGSRTRIWHRSSEGTYTSGRSPGRASTSRRIDPLPYKGPVITDAAGRVDRAADRARRAPAGDARTGRDRTAGAFPYLVSAARVSVLRRILDAAARDGVRPLLAVTQPVILETEAEAARAPRAPISRRICARRTTRPAGGAGVRARRLDEAGLGRPGGRDGGVGLSRHPARAHPRHASAAGADHVAMLPLAPDGTTEQLADARGARRGLVTSGHP